MKIYTKSGDRGDTSLASGLHVSKGDRRIVCIGEIDELNAILGLVLESVKNSAVGKIVIILQRDLFELGAEIAGSKGFKIGSNKIKLLEKWIDEIEKTNQPLKNFILPGGTKAASALHLARAVSRRMERSLVKLNQEEGLTEEILKYANRLSDLLFVMARKENLHGKFREEIWRKTAS
jgi:cob(I)alamin adenosyltransferase